MRRFLAVAALLLLSLAPARADTPWELVHAYPHDSDAFTEGLLWLDGNLYESTGQYGASEIREVDLKSGKVLRSIALPNVYFGEGIVDWGDEIISLTWRNHIGFRWRHSDFGMTGSFGYPGEGWGMTHDGTHVIMSDGTDELRLLDPKTMVEIRRISVTWNGKPVRLLNELEYVKGEILANTFFIGLLDDAMPSTDIHAADYADLYRGLLSRE
ncbi:MAG: glutaminyl-peptide cyclotransferase, partial [Sphingobium sp.]